MLKLIVIAIGRFIGLVPLPIVYGLGRGAGCIYGRIIRYHRKDAFAALERSLPGKSSKEYRRIVNKVYRNIGLTLMEAIHYYLKGPASTKAVMTLENKHHLEKALSRGKGAIILTAHFGNFDLLPLIATHQGYKITLIARGMHNKTINDLSFKMRQREGITCLPKRNAYRDCLKALRRKELVGIILDQNMTRKEGVFVDYFGKPACTSPGLAFMAAQSQAPVVPAFIYRQPKGRHIVKLLPPIDPPADRSPESIREATQTYTKIIEDTVRETPDHWIWIHRRWRTVPPSTDELKPQISGEDAPAKTESPNLSAMLKN